MTFTYNGTTYAPLRALAEAYGLEVGYDAEKKMATVGYYSEDTYGAVTDKMDEALDSALYYLSIFNFSRHALSGQLAIDGYSAEEAEYAVEIDYAIENIG